MSRSPDEDIHLIHVSENLATIMVNSRNSVTVSMPTNEVLDFIMDQCKSEDRVRIQALLDDERQVQQLMESEGMENPWEVRNN